VFLEDLSAHSIDPLVVGLEAIKISRVAGYLDMASVICALIHLPASLPPRRGCEQTHIGKAKSPRPPSARAAKEPRQWSDRSMKRDSAIGNG
jgi:hypothetical protein